MKRATKGGGGKRKEDTSVGGEKPESINCVRIAQRTIGERTGEPEEDL